MSNGLPHEEARNALEALALDALDASERTAVLAHVDGCTACRHDLAALENVAAQLAYAVTPVPMSDAVRDRVKARLMNRVASRRNDMASGGDVLAGRISNPHATSGTDGRHDAPSKLIPILVPHGDTTPEPQLIVHSTARGAWWVAAAATLVATVSLASLYQLSKERGDAATALETVSVDNSWSRRVVDSLRASLADRDRMIADLTGPNVAVMTLASTDPSAPSALMFWNQSLNAWTFVAHNLPMPAAGRSYQLWLVTAKEKISAGMFMPRRNGDAMMRTTYALAKDALAEVAVTDEPAAGSPQPTTTPVIVGPASAR